MAILSGLKPVLLGSFLEAWSIKNTLTAVTTIPNATTADFLRCFGSLLKDLFAAPIQVSIPLLSFLKYSLTNMLSIFTFDIPVLKRVPFFNKESVRIII